MNKGWVDQDDLAPVARPRRQLLEGEEEEDDEGTAVSSGLPLCGQWEELDEVLLQMCFCLNDCR